MITHGMPLRLVPVELYDLASDIGEEKNLAERRPEVTEELRQMLESWRQEVCADE